jgi:hypothetical protein
MFRSGADALREEGRVEGAIRALQQALLDLLRSKFRRIPRATEKVIRATRDQDELHAWLVRTANAETIEEIGIAP